MTFFHRIYRGYTGTSQWRPGHPAMSNEEKPIALLACSMSIEHRDLFYVSNRALCEDRQKALEHFMPRRLFKSTIRVTMMQSAHIISKYATDQVKEDVERDELVAAGVLTQAEADEQADSWAEREWKKRTDDFHVKLATALAKYHATIMIMRFYEFVADKVFYVSEETLDKLTMDTFKCGKRKAREGKQGTELAREMYGVCWRANLISFLADYSVHQIILVFGYYAYVREQQRRRRSRVADSGREHENSDNMPGGPLVLNLLRKSTLLALSRGVALGFASAGGAIGSMVSPAWGTLIGTNMGDGLAAALTEDLVETAST